MRKINFYWGTFKETINYKSLYEKLITSYLPFFFRQVVKCTNVIIRKDEKRNTQLEFMAVRNDNHERCS